MTTKKQKIISNDPVLRIEQKIEKYNSELRNIGSELRRARTKEERETLKGQETNIREELSKLEAQKKDSIDLA